MKIINSKQLSHYLKDVRFNKNLSQKDVAAEVGLRQETISNFEKDPSSKKLDTLFKILSSLNLEIEINSKNSNSKDHDWNEEW